MNKKDERKRFAGFEIKKIFFLNKLLVSLKEKKIRKSCIVFWKDYLINVN